MKEGSSPSAYCEAGVDIDAQQRALQRVKKLVGKTHTKAVLSEAGSFGGLFRPDLSGLEEPVLVASADGVGTKLMVARMAGDFSTVGRDLVNHCVNDILVQGARPLFFLDYVGAGTLDPNDMVELVRGVAEACRRHDCALLGGETAEMPDIYSPGDYELVGFIVGVVERKAILDGSGVRPKDLILGLPSSGLHTNGYSLARKVLFDRLGLAVEDRIPGAKSQKSVGRLLLEPHRSYWQAVAPVLDHPALHALVHVTGGGLTDNLPRILPKRTHAAITVGSWEVPEIFHLLQEHGEIDSGEMFRVFNMGVGMVMVVDPEGVGDILRRLRKVRQAAFPIGAVQNGGSGVVYDLPSTAQ